MSSREQTRRVATVAAAVLLALLAAGQQGVTAYRDRSPAVAVSARGNEPVTLGNTQVAVRSFTVAPTLPAQDATDPPVRGPEGSVLVLVVWTQVVGPGVKIDEHFCDSSLVADDGTVWPKDSDYTYAVRRPDALTCGHSDSRPLVVGQPREIGDSFVIPARYADQVRWRMSFDDGRQAVEVRR